LNTKPNIFKLYETHIGPLTPSIADKLIDAEEEYSSEWIEDAIQIAVDRNKRFWSYCVAILRRWKMEGRDSSPNRSQPPSRSKKESYAQKLLDELEP
jgi:DnaD/phage-associated family protein